MSLEKQITLELKDLGDEELRQVAEFLAFLKFRSRRAGKSLPSAKRLSAIYAESATEDRAMAEEDMASYGRRLAREDRK